MKSQRFGIEIEMTGLTRRSAALIIAKHFDTGRHERGVYDTYSVCDQDGRKWKIEMPVLHRSVEIDLIMILIIKLRSFRLSVIMKILKRYRALFVN